MTDSQIERHVQQMTDSADRAYMARRMTTEEYERRIKAIDRWAEQKYSRVGRQ